MQYGKQYTDINTGKTVTPLHESQFGVWVIDTDGVRYAVHRDSLQEVTSVPVLHVSPDDITDIADQMGVAYTPEQVNQWLADAVDALSDSELLMEIFSVTLELVIAD